jgi:hypothetical protein
VTDTRGKYFRRSRKKNSRDRNLASKLRYSIELRLANREMGFLGGQSCESSAGPANGKRAGKMPFVLRDKPSLRKRRELGWFSFDHMDHCRGGRDGLELES